MTFGRLRDLGTKLEREGGVLLSISLDAGDPLPLRQKARRLNPPGRLCLDGRGFAGAAARLLGVEAVPAYRLVEANGTVRVLSNLGEAEALFSKSSRPTDEEAANTRPR